MSTFAEAAAVNVAALLRTGLLDAPADEHFDKITTMAGRLLKVPVSLVSLVDADRQFFASACGLAEPWATRRETPLTHSFCQHVVLTDAPLQVNDARTDPLVRDNRAVEELGVVAYLGMPLRTAARVTVGSLCVIDSRPREWTAEDLATLHDLSQLADAQIALRGELRTALVEMAGALGEVLAPARTLAAVRTTDEALAEAVRADFTLVREVIARHDALVARLGER